MLFSILIITGLISGVMSSFLGIGGGTIILPVLYFLFPHYPATTIIGSALFAILVNTTANTIWYKKQQIVIDYKILLKMLPFIIIGIILGNLLAHSLHREALKGILGVLLLTSAHRLIFITQHQGQNNQKTESIFYKLIIALTSILSGVIATSTGLGGGIVFVPLFINTLRLPMDKIPAYSNATMIITTGIGSLSYFIAPTPQFTFDFPFFETLHFGAINMGIAIIIASFSIISGHLGVTLLQKVSANALRKIFAVLLLVFGSKMIFDLIFT